MKMKNKNFFKINFIYFTAMICVAVVFVLGYAGVIKNEVLSSFLIQIVVMFAIPLLMYTVLISRNVKQTFKDAGFKKLSGKMIALTILIGIVLYFVNSFVADAFSSIIALFGYENLYGATTIRLTYKYLLKDFILSAIFPAFCEEFLHRGIMLFSNKKVNNPRYCLIISSILFGLMHLNINQFFYAAILGGLTGYVALCADSIYCSMIIHFINNFLSSYFLYGLYLNFPLARFVNGISTAIRSNIIIFIITATAFILLLFISFKLLTDMLRRERAKNEVKQIIQNLNLENLSYDEMQSKISLANDIISKSKISIFAQSTHTQSQAQADDKQSLQENNNLNTNPLTKKSVFVDKIFLIMSFVLGSLITIMTFIWGII